MSKKIFIVDASDYMMDFIIRKLNTYDIYPKEIHLPTEEEIMDIVRSHLILTMNDEPFASELIAKKILDKILNQ